MPSFTRVPHAQPSLSNFPWRDSDFGERTCSRGMTQLKQKFPSSPQNQKTKLTHCSIHVPMRTISIPGGNEIFQLPPKIKRPNLHIVRYTCQFKQYLPHTQNERCAHPSWAPTKEPTVSCWRYTPTPKQDRFQDLLEAICPDFLHTNLTKYNK